MDYFSVDSSLTSGVVSPWISEKEFSVVLPQRVRPWKNSGCDCSVKGSRQTT